MHGDRNMSHGDLSLLQQQNKQDEVLEYYHVDSIEQLIEIMIDPVKSQTYNQVRAHPAPYMDIQNFTAIKSSIQYKRQLLLNLLHQVHLQKKEKNNKNQKITPSQKKILNLVLSQQTSRQKKQTNSTSNYSYEELQAYFKTNKDTLLCKKILSLKYHRCELMHAHKIRKQFWLMLIGLEKKKQFYPLAYENLLNHKEYPDFFNKIIMADVSRTIYDIDQKQKKDYSQKMHRILQSYARRNPYIGYCQGMNFIVNFIMTMGFEEEECFWILVTALQEIAPIGYYTNMSGVAIDIKILQILLELSHPKIHKKLQALEIDISVFALQWFVCLFTSTLPFYLLVIVWDLLLISGTAVLLKVALIMLEYMGSIIDEAKDFAHFFKLYDALKKKIYIEEELFISKFNAISIDLKILALVREIFETQIRHEKQISKKDTKENQKWKQAQCCQQWPICIQQLKRYKHCDLEIDVWVLKQEGPPKIIRDYLGQKQKKSQKPAFDGREQFKKLLIGRVPHICNRNASQIKCKENESIELSQLLEQKQKTQGMSPDFFHRATLNNFALQQLLYRSKK